MSTRAFVTIEGNGSGMHESVTLYRHSDGYPDEVIPTIQRAYDLVHAAPRWAITEKVNYSDCWKGNRAGYVAGFLCAAEYGAYQPRSGHERSGDEEWDYLVTLESCNRWKVRVSKRKIRVFGPTLEIGSHTVIIDTVQETDVVTLLTGVPQSTVSG